MHLGEKGGAHSKEDATYAHKRLFKEHNTINVHFVRAHDDELFPSVVEDRVSYGSAFKFETGKAVRRSRSRDLPAYQGGSIENTFVAVQTCVTGERSLSFGSRD